MNSESRPNTPLDRAVTESSTGEEPHGGGVAEHRVHRRLHRPFATAPLILANVVVFLAPFVLGLFAWDSMLPLTHPLGVEMGASIGDSRSLREPWRLITANFLHAGLIHLGCNMITLWSVGRWVESLLGPRRFLTVYVVSGLGAVAASSIAGGTERISLGASGAILGVAWGVIVLLYRIRHVLPAGVARRSIITLSVLLSLPLILLPFVAPVDNWGHAGGSIVGAIAMAMMPIGRRPSIVWSALMTVPLIAFVLIGTVLPIVLLAEVGTNGVGLTRIDTVDDAWVRIPVGEDWVREDVDQEITWVSSSGIYASLGWERRRRGKSATAVLRIESDEQQLEAEKRAGRYLDVRVFYEEDMQGDGVGGIIAGYVITLPGEGWKGWITGRVEQRRVRVVRFFDGVHGPTHLIFYGPDSVHGRELGLEFVRGVRPIR